MRNSFNYLMANSVIGAILVRIGCLVYSMLWDENRIVLIYTLQFYFYYQLTFDLINIASIAQILQWIDVMFALISTIDLDKLA